jgi:hypothetical protein
VIRTLTISLLAALLVSACQTTGSEVSRAAPEYLGVDTFLLDGDLVQFEVTMKGAYSPQELDRYANCAAAQYTLIRGYGYARHVRTKLKQEGGIWAADAVYTISPSLPRGLRTIDASVEVADCEANGIPTV